MNIKTNDMNIKQRRIKVGTHYFASGYGRGLNKRNVYLIDGKCYVYHMAYWKTAYTQLHGEFKGYMEVNCITIGGNSFHTLSYGQDHHNYTFENNELIKC